MYVCILNNPESRTNFPIFYTNNCSDRGRTRDLKSGRQFDLFAQYQRPLYVNGSHKLTSDLSVIQFIQASLCDSTYKKLHILFIIEFHFVSFTQKKYN